MLYDIIESTTSINMAHYIICMHAFYLLDIQCGIYGIESRFFRVYQNHKDGQKAITNF